MRYISYPCFPNILRVYLKKKRKSKLQLLMGLVLAGFLFVVHQPFFFAGIYSGWSSHCFITFISITNNHLSQLHSLIYSDLSCYFLCICIVQAATKTLARQLIRLRQQITKLQGSRAQMRGIATHTQVKSHNHCVLLVRFLRFCIVPFSSYPSSLSKCIAFCRQYLPNHQLLWA